MPGDKWYTSPWQGKLPECQGVPQKGKEVEHAFMCRVWMAGYESAKCITVIIKKPVLTDDNTIPCI